MYCVEDRAYYHYRYRSDYGTDYGYDDDYYDYDVAGNYYGYYDCDYCSKPEQYCECLGIERKANEEYRYERKMRYRRKDREKVKEKKRKGRHGIPKHLLLKTGKTKGPKLFKAKVDKRAVYLDRDDNLAYPSLLDKNARGIILISRSSSRKIDRVEIMPEFESREPHSGDPFPLLVKGALLKQVDNANQAVKNSGNWDRVRGDPCLVCGQHLFTREFGCKHSCHIYCFLEKAKQQHNVSQWWDEYPGRGWGYVNVRVKCINSYLFDSCPLCLDKKKCMICKLPWADKDLTCRLGEHQSHNVHFSCFMQTAKTQSGSASHGIELADSCIKCLELRSCPICMETWASSTLTCGHHLHKTCHQKLVTHQKGEIIRPPTCPCCRKGLGEAVTVIENYYSGVTRTVDVSGFDFDSRYYRICLQCTRPFEVAEKSCIVDLEVLSKSCEDCRIKRLIKCPNCGLGLEHAGGCSYFTCCLYGSEGCARRPNCDHGSNSFTTFCGYKWYLPRGSY